jgi:hypothetical protein
MRKLVAALLVSATVFVTWSVFLRAGERPVALRARLTVRVARPEGFDKAVLYLRLYREGPDGLEKEGPPRRVEGNQAIFGDLTPGRYRLATPEDTTAEYGLEVTGLAEVGPAAEPVSVTVQAKPVDVVEVEVRAVTNPGGEPVEGKLAFWRDARDVCEIHLLPEKRTIRLVAGSGYSFEVRPDRWPGFRPSKTTVGPITPESVRRTGLAIQVPVEVPVFSYQWKVVPADRQRLSERAMLQSELHRVLEDGSREQLAQQWPTCPVDRAAYAGVSPEAAQKDPKCANVQRLYGLADGAYELNARILPTNTSLWADVLTLDSPVRFVVKGGKATPSNVTLVFSSAATGSIQVTVLDREDKPLPGARIDIATVEGNIIEQGQTGPTGTWATPRFASGEYEVRTFAPDLPPLHRRVALSQGTNRVTLRFGELVTVRGTAVDGSGKPVGAECRYYPGLDASMPRDFMPSQTSAGGFALDVPRDSFPMLILGVDVETGVWQGQVLDQPPTGNVTLRFADGPRREITAMCPLVWIKDSQDPGRFVYLWFSRKGSIAPAAIWKLRPGGKTRVVAAMGKTMTLEGDVKLNAGDYELLLQIGLGQGTKMAWLGPVTVPPTGPVQLTLAEESVRAQGTLAEVREAVTRAGSGQAPQTK